MGTNYSGLVEPYVADKIYPDGTVVTFGGKNDVTKTSEGDRGIGVMVTTPTGPGVLIKGTALLLAVGDVQKGDRLVATDDGFARVTPPGHPDVFAIALGVGKSQKVWGSDPIQALIL
jgi:hypothetical protein